MKVLQNRGLLGYLIGVVALVVALLILGRHHVGHELGHGILFALLVGVVLIVLVWLFLVHGRKTVTLTWAALLAIIVVVAAVFSVVKISSVDISFGLWNTRGFFFWLVLIIGAILASLVGYTSRRVATPHQNQTRQGTPAEQPYLPV